MIYVSCLRHDGESALYTETRSFAAPMALRSVGPRVMMFGAAVGQVAALPNCQPLIRRGEGGARGSGARELDGNASTAALWPEDHD